MRYSVVIHKDKESDFGVIVPDLPGCYSAGATYDEALKNAEEAVACHLEGLLIDGEPLPVAQVIDHHLANKEFSNGIWAFVEVDLSSISGKAKRINITLPDRVLRLIDLYAKNHNIKNRSAFLADAVISYIAHHS